MPPKLAKKKRNNGRKNQLSEKQVSIRPFEFSPITNVKKTFRFICTASGNSPWKTIDLFNLQCIVTSGTTIVSTLQGIELKKIRIWQTGTVTGGAGTISLSTINETAGNVGEKPINKSDQSNNQSQIAYLMFKPIKGTSLGSYQNVLTGSTTTGGTTITIGANTGDTLDVTVLYQLNNTLNAADKYLVTTYTTTSGTGVIINPTQPTTGTGTWTCLNGPNK